MHKWCSAVDSLDLEPTPSALPQVRGGPAGRADKITTCDPLALSLRQPVHYRLSVFKSPQVVSGVVRLLNATGHLRTLSDGHDKDA
jgi:hypothetical protein